MDFLFSRNINPHICLHALSLTPLNNQPDVSIKRLNLLAKTRLFDDIKATSQKVTNFSFPSLEKNLQIAKEQSNQQKKQLGEANIFQILKDLDEKSKAEDANFQVIDQEQQKVYRVAHILFDEGDYKKCHAILVQLQKQDLKEQIWLKSTWSRLYCEIILNSESSVKTVESLKKKIDQIQSEELEYHAKSKLDNKKVVKRIYSQKEQFLILSLFVLLKNGTEENIQRFVDYCTNDKSYFSVIQLTCPQLLRYIIGGIALNKTLHNNRSFDLFKLVEAINRKIIRHNDAFTNFISKIEIQYDFQGAIKAIDECRQLIRQDVFLAPLEKKIIEGLQFLYFKLVCKVYESIPLSQIASFINASVEDAQLWILGYIRSGDIDAKIDSIAELVVNTKGKHNSNEKYIDFIPQVGGLVNGLSRAIISQ